MSQPEQSGEISTTSGAVSNKGTSSESVHEIMDRIRREVGEILRAAPKPFLGTNGQDLASATRPARGNDVQAGELQHSAELRAINHGHAYSLDINPGRIPVSHRFGPLGRLVTAFKRKLLSQLRDSILAQYFKSEHEFESAVTKFLNEMPRYVDERDGVIFRQLIHKIDTDVGASVERTDRGLQELAGSLETVKLALQRNIESGKHEYARKLPTVAATSPLAVSPSMSPHVVALVEQVNQLAARVEALERERAQQNGGRP